MTFAESARVVLTPPDERARFGNALRDSVVLAGTRPNLAKVFLPMIGTPPPLPPLGRRCRRLITVESALPVNG